MPTQRRAFPEDFVFGAATAAYQIEGATTADGRGASIWDTFVRTPGVVLDGDTGDIACDHYHRYAEDIALMGRLGLQSYRFSTSWARVVPDGSNVNARGLDFYRRLVDELLAHDITPWLTLYHWDLPQAVQDTGGWPHRDTVHRFTEYALAVHDALGDRVPVWTTLNEPQCSAFVGHIAGRHAPGHTSATEGLLAAHHLLLAHGRAMRELRARDGGLTLGITLNLAPVDPVDPGDDRDRDAARRLDGQFNRWFLDPLFRGAYPADILRDLASAVPDAANALTAAIHADDLRTIAAPVDALGINYYQGACIGATPAATPPPSGDAPTARGGRSSWPLPHDLHGHDRGLPRTAMNWEVDPAALTRLLHRVTQEYTGATRTRLFVTENGAAYDDHPVTEHGRTRIPDTARADFLIAHLAAILDAVDAGVDVGGYFAWSLLDNFEWAWGYTRRFGLVHVDYATQRRTLKDSAHAYRDIIRTRSIPA
ncbi:GH1 family beta-glucosidase [Streptosporangium longisporum]|uniref:Beta-glucosidase n=1 Tax=Streptosporangium longisporum TaxID=46187 RepID=A0ABN3Y3Q8_9ACTN